MEIIISVLEKYFEKAGYPVHISINLEQRNLEGFSVTAGRPEDNGKLRVFITYNDLNEILLINNILGENGLLMTVQDVPFDNYVLKQQKINDLVYGTLEKYIYQMLQAGLNKEFYPEITPLPKHQRIFWPRKVAA